MFLKELKIINIRNIQKLSIQFNSNLVYIYAPNGTGKTNLLEAIQLLCIGKSLRTQEQKSILPTNLLQSKVPFSSTVQGKFMDDNLFYEKQIKIFPGLRIKKELVFNNNVIKMSDFIGRPPSIWFGIETIKILTSSPNSKRKFIDDALIQLNKNYYLYLRRYQRSLKQRNKILKTNPTNKELIDIWTENLVKYGSIVTLERKKFCDDVNNIFYKQKTLRERYFFKLTYKPNIYSEANEYDSICQKYYQNLNQNYPKDLLLQTTTVGPHKDSWDILFKDHTKHTDYLSMQRFASRGQQRMGLISLIEALVQLFINKHSTKPILLLDDITAELDKQNISILTNVISELHNIQVFITGINFLNEIDSENIQKIKLYEIL